MHGKHLFNLATGLGIAIALSCSNTSFASEQSQGQEINLYDPSEIHYECVLFQDYKFVLTYNQNNIFSSTFRFSDQAARLITDLTLTPKGWSIVGARHKVAIINTPIFLALSPDALNAVDGMNVMVLYSRSYKDDPSLFEHEIRCDVREF